MEVFTAIYVVLCDAENTIKHDGFETRGNHAGDPPFLAFFLERNTPPPWWLVGWVGWWVAGWAGWAGWLAGWAGWLAGWLVGWLGMVIGFD